MKYKNQKLYLHLMRFYRIFIERLKLFFTFARYQNQNSELFNTQIVI